MSVFLVETDKAGLQKFYRDLFGWVLSPPVIEMGNYSMLERPESGIGGGFGEGDARVSMYIEVADPERYVARAVAGGATVLMPVTQITPTTTIAMLLDPAGNTFGVMLPRPAPRKTTKPTTAKKTPRKKTAVRKKTTVRKNATAARPKKRTRRS